VAERSDADGQRGAACTTFVYLDGAERTGRSTALARRAGGEAAAAGRLAAARRSRLDVRARNPHREATDGIVHRELSAPRGARRAAPAPPVFELIVAQPPAFTELKVQDEWLGLGAQGAGRAAPADARDVAGRLGALLAGEARPTR